MFIEKSSLPTLIPPNKQCFETKDGNLIVKDGLLMIIRQHLGYALDLEEVDCTQN